MRSIEEIKAELREAENAAVLESARANCPPGFKVHTFGGLVDFVRGPWCVSPDGKRWKCRRPFDVRRPFLMVSEFYGDTPTEAVENARSELMALALELTP